MIRTVAALLALATPVAPLHVEPQISEAPAGSRTTFSFVVEHGCDGAATVEMAIQIPEGAFDIVPAAPEGWSGSVEEGTQAVVRFTGGPLADDLEEAFGFEMVTPNLPGETIFFPTVQTCEAGEIAWIDTSDGAEEPAPRIVLTANDQPILPTSTTAPPATTTSTTSSAGPGSTAPATTAAQDDDGNSGDDDADMPVAAIVALALAAAAGAAVLAIRRRA